MKIVTAKLKTAGAFTQGADGCIYLNLENVELVETEEQNE